MKRAKVHVHTVQVSQQGQKVYFQINLPRSAKTITSIEVGCRVKPIVGADNTDPYAPNGIGRHQDDHGGGHGGHDDPREDPPVDPHDDPHSHH